IVLMAMVRRAPRCRHHRTSPPGTTIAGRPAKRGKNARRATENLQKMPVRGRAAENEKSRRGRKDPPAFREVRAPSVQLDVVLDVRGHQADDFAGQSHDLSWFIAVLPQVLVDGLRE